GGYDGAALSSVDEFDPVANSWTPRAALGGPRSGLVALSLGGKIYAAGGWNTGPGLTKVEVYDQASDAWTGVPGLNVGRGGLAGAVVSGRMYAGDGDDGSTLLKDLDEGVLGVLPGMTLTFTITGQAGAVCGATDVSNTAWVSGVSACAAQELVTNATGFTIQAPAVAFTVSKTQTPANPGIGDTVTYLLTVMNTGTATIQNIVVTDTVSTLLTSVTTSGLGTPVVTSTAEGMLYTWTGQNIAFRPGTTGTLTITGQVAAVCQATLVGNTAYVVASSACDSTSQTVASNGTSFTVSPPAFAFTVSKTMSPASPVLGGPVTYRIDVANTGAATLFELTVVDTLSGAIAGATTMAPAEFTAPVVTTLPPNGGTRYVWSMARPVTWTSKMNMPTNRQLFGGAAVNGRFYAIGGFNPGILSTVEEYDPATDIWTTRNPMPTARYEIS
ncbi:MAG: hypothetical protein AAB368_17740, partial [bacterium]